MNVASSIIPNRRTPAMVIFYIVAVVSFVCVSGGRPVLAIQRLSTIDEYTNDFEPREMKSKSKGGKKSKDTYYYYYYYNVSKDGKDSKKDKNYSKPKRDSKLSRSEDGQKGKKEGEIIVGKDTQDVKNAIEGNIGEIVDGRVDLDVIDIEKNEINRTVKILHLDAPNECMTYNSTLDQQFTIYMVNCSTDSEESNDEITWELLETTIEDNFYLRHKSSQQCIPQNPESPGKPFDCDRYSRKDQAIADSINGLIDCTSEFAASFGMNTTTNSLQLTNTDCSDELNIIFMSYSRRELPNEIQTIVWGEMILLNLSDIIEEHNFQYEWVFKDIVK